MKENEILTKMPAETIAVMAADEAGYNMSQLDVLDNHIRWMIERKMIQAGAYLISLKGRIIAHKAIGYLRYNDSRPFLPDTIRRIASVTKIFVATSILQLIEKGKLRLDQSVSEILKEFKNPMYEKINITHLLTHTSGVMPDPGVFFEPYPLGWKAYGTKNWIKAMLTGSLAVEPGKEWRYSSAGFTILAEIVSRVSGVHFEKYVIDNIARPLGMNDTFFDVPDELSGRVCFTNKYEEKWFHESKKRPEWAPPRGGGGLFSTLGDMQKMGQMLINKGTLGNVRILSRKTVEAMTRNHTKGVKNYCWGAGGTEMEYGLGMNVYSNNTFLSPGSFSHEGAGLCGLYMDPVENMVLAYICPLCEGIVWLPEPVVNLRNIVWAGIV
ncbi:MAG: serine hydrolase domain-containing protein [Bacillota bacterium]